MDLRSWNSLKPRFLLKQGAKGLTQDVRVKPKTVHGHLGGRGTVTSLVLTLTRGRKIGRRGRELGGVNPLDGQNKKELSCRSKLATVIILTETVHRAIGTDFDHVSWETSVQGVMCAASLPTMIVNTVIGSGDR